MSTRKKISLEEAARLNHYCPMCRFVHFDARPTKRRCAACGELAYDCCVAGHNVMCPNCVELETIAAQSATGAPEDGQ